MGNFTVTVTGRTVAELKSSLRSLSESLSSKNKMPKGEVDNADTKRPRPNDGSPDTVGNRTPHRV